MDTLTPAPPISPEHVVLARHPHPRRWPVVVVVVVVIAVMSWAIAWVSNYEPLRFVSGAYRLGPPRLVLRSFDASAPGGDNFTQYVIRLDPTTPVTFSFDMTNDGPVPVTVTGFPTEPVGESAFHIDRVELGPATHTSSEYMPSSAVPFAPFRLAPHDTRYVSITGTYHGCWGAHGAAIGSTVETSFRVFGVPRTSMFVLPMTIEATTVHDVCG